jgi:M6 family metalloprotease-like protein
MGWMSLGVRWSVGAVCVFVVSACGAPHLREHSTRLSEEADGIPLRAEDPLTGSLRVLIIPVEFDEWKHDKPLGPDNPSNPPVDIAALSERYNTLASNYFHVTSRGNLQVSFHVFPRWLNLGKMSKYSGGAFSARPLLDDAIARYGAERGDWPGEGSFDKTVVVFSSPSWADEWPDEWAGTGWNPDRDFIHPIAAPTGANGKASCVNAGAGVGVITHELGHAILQLKDKDVQKRVPNYRYDLMGAGSWNGVDVASPEAKQSTDVFKNTMPALVTPWNRINLGWEETPLRLAPGSESVTVTLEAATTEPELTSKPQVNSEAGEKEPRIIALEIGSDQIYLLENRAPLGWDQALPAWGLLAWSIRPSWRATTRGDSDYDRGVWESVVDMHPETQDAPKSFKYSFIDNRTKAFSAFSHSRTGVTYTPLGLFDAPLNVGERWNVPGTSLKVSVRERTAAGSLVLDISGARRLE